MYAPANNRVDDPAQQLAFMREYNFAALVSRSGASGLSASHLPFVVDADERGLLLQAHLARENPQCDELAQAHELAHEVLVIFSGPHAYISPTHYERHPSVPTWNYLALHAHGTIRRVESEAARMASLERLVAVHDPAFSPTLVALPSDYRDRMLAHIVAIEIRVSRIEARFKLSQDRSPTERARIVTALEVGDAAAQALAAKMRAG